MRFSDFKIGQRLGAAFGLLVLMTMAWAKLGLQQLRKIQDDLDTVVNDNHVKSELAHQMNESSSRASPARWCSRGNRCSRTA
ncbi:hypothetical protein HHL10_22745 [Azohydromonas sp. G-1-1-14]|uniref:Methyl-accepting chemotaxis protein n=1 Tax=Azohydromonas caseinilytica TaxID=2728836 RepID=A0A848FEE7_9BURK|nr:hypothetical protein [Azohydromonas caseinilytica]